MIEEDNDPEPTQTLNEAMREVRDEVWAELLSVVLTIEDVAFAALKEHPKKPIAFTMHGETNLETRSFVVEAEVKISVCEKSDEK